MYMYQKKIIKIKNSLLVIFGEIWLETLYYSTGTLARFRSNFKNSQKKNFDWNQLKLSIQHKNMYMHQKKIKKWKVISLLFLMKYPNLGSQSTFNSKICYQNHSLFLFISFSWSEIAKSCNR